MEKETSTARPPLTEAQLTQLRALEGRQPDTSDIPEASEENWHKARSFSRPCYCTDTDE